MSSFYEQLLKEIFANLPNNFTDNHDFYRFGAKKENYRQKLRNKFKALLSKRSFILADSWVFQANFENISLYFPKFERFYNLLSDDCSKKLLIKLVAYRLLGEEKIKLPLSTPKYWQDVSGLEKIEQPASDLKVSFDNWKLAKFEMESFGFPLTLNYSVYGVYCTFLARQYDYANDQIIKVSKGDVVLDVGSCWGDTALYFANETKEAGRVYGFEFIPSNLQVLKANLDLNPELSTLIEITERPVWSETDKKLNYLDNGPGSKVSFDALQKVDGSANTITIDDFVKERNLSKIDFIKMDIEGAEPNALEGARETLNRFKPKLAIAIYHSLDDFVEIPAFIDSLNLDYRLYLGHFTINAEETILFATADKFAQ